MSITVYTKPNCDACNATKLMLDKKHLEYRTVDVTEDDTALRFITHELGYRQMPVVVVDDITHWSGFRIEAPTTSTASSTKNWPPSAQRPNTIPTLTSGARCATTLDPGAPGTVSATPDAPTSTPPNTPVSNATTAHGQARRPRPEPPPRHTNARNPR